MSSLATIAFILGIGNLIMIFLIGYHILKVLYEIRDKIKKP